MVSLFRSVSSDGEFLVVRVLAGLRVFSALGNRDDLVRLTAGRRARLLSLPHELCGGVVADDQGHHSATYEPLPGGEDCGFGFTLDGSSVVVDIERLPKDQVLRVFPESEV